MKNQCELCNLENKTKWYYENDNWIICDCSHCNSPIAVYKKHEQLVPIQELKYIMDWIMSEFPFSFIRTKQRKIKDHFHFHIYRSEQDARKNNL